MFRARALAARGSAVVVVSWQQWQELQGSQQLQARLLEDKLWLLRRQQLVMRRWVSGRTNEWGACLLFFL